MFEHVRSPTRSTKQALLQLLSPSSSINLPFSHATRKSSKSIFNMAEHPTNADAIADAKISPGDDYEEIREQVRL
jgi:hypothetical protein